jgi:hypothetical protein
VFANDAVCRDDLNALGYGTAASSLAKPLKSAAEVI